MFSFIEKLQQASLVKRKSVVFFVSTTLTFVIFGFWFVTFTRTNTSAVAEVAGLSKDQSASPFDAISHAVKSLFDGSFQEYERR